MSFGEAVRLLRLVRADPGSQIATALEGWKYPFPREQALAADLWDLQYAKTGAKKPAKYPRPYVEPPATIRRGNAAGRSPEEMKALLREHFGRVDAPV